MKILSISSDRRVFEKGSAVRARLLDYGQLAEELHVVVFAKRSLGFTEEKIAPNIFLYTSNSLGRICYISSTVIRALKLKRSGVRIDVVTTQDPFEAGLAGYLIARIFKSRLHIQIHTDVMSPYFNSESFLNRVRVIIAKFLIPRADALRVVSERIKDSIEHLVEVGTQITVLPIFVVTTPDAEDKSFKKKYPQFSKTLLIASRLSREKNIGIVIDAMREVTKKYPATGLVIVGDGPELLSLKKIAMRFHLDVNVMFEGWKKDLTPYYKTADALILPSFYEGYGMVAVEALAAGCPVIMTDVGCAGDIVKDRENGLVVPIGSLASLTYAIDGVISGKVKLTAKLPELPTKEKYLAIYKKSWENALA